jgi:hypothetical protein
MFAPLEPAQSTPPGPGARGVQQRGVTRGRRECALGGASRLGNVSRDRPTWGAGVPPDGDLQSRRRWKTRLSSGEGWDAMASGGGVGGRSIVAVSIRPSQGSPGRASGNEAHRIPIGVEENGGEYVDQTGREPAKPARPLPVGPVAEGHELPEPAPQIAHLAASPARLELPHLVAERSIAKDVQHPA